MSKIARTEKEAKEGVVPPTVLELDAVPILYKNSNDGNDRGKERVMDTPVLDEEERKYSLGRDVVKGSLTKKSWSQLNV